MTLGIKKKINHDYLDMRKFKALLNRFINV